jgi:hypothetical protein
MRCAISRERCSDIAMKLRTAIAALLPAAAFAVYGVDISAPLDQNTANCFVQQAGVSFGTLHDALVPYKLGCCI